MGTKIRSIRAKARNHGISLAIPGPDQLSGEPEDLFAFERIQGVMNSDEKKYVLDSFAEEAIRSFLAFHEGSYNQYRKNKNSVSLDEACTILKKYINNNKG